MAADAPSASRGRATAAIVVLAVPSTARSTAARRSTGHASSPSWPEAGGRPERTRGRGDRSGAPARARLQRPHPALLLPGKPPLAECRRPDAGPARGHHRRSHGRGARHEARTTTPLASGRVLMLAQYLKDEPGVLVAALGAEEERRYTGAGWHLGSRKLTRSLSPEEKEGVRLALSIDMVGVGWTLNIRGLRRAPTGRRGSCSTPPTAWTSGRATCATPASPTTTTSRAAASRRPGSSGAGTTAGTCPATESTA